MPTWRRSQQQQLQSQPPASLDADTACGQCGQKGSAVGKLFCADDGYSYCASCWEAYYGSPPTRTSVLAGRQVDSRPQDDGSDSDDGFWEYDISKPLRTTACTVSAKQANAAAHAAEKSAGYKAAARGAEKASFHKKADSDKTGKPQSSSGALADSIRVRQHKPSGEAKAASRGQRARVDVLADMPASMPAMASESASTSASSSSSTRLATSSSRPLSSAGSQSNSAASSSKDKKRPPESNAPSAVVAPRQLPGSATIGRFLHSARALMEEEGEDAQRESQQEQLDELETLRAIYGESLLRVESDGSVAAFWPEGAGVDDVRWPVWFKLEVPVEWSGMHANEAVQLMVDTADGQVVAGMVNTLPPLALYCALPRGYPLLADGPKAVVAIHAKHLGEDSEAARALEAELESLFDERPGEQLLFECASLLQERATLGSNKLLLGDGAAATAVAMQRALDLLGSDQRTRDERRQQQLHTCPCCFDEVLGSRGIFLDCGHFGCRACLEHMAQLYTGEGDVSALRCPDPDCREAFGLHILQQLLPADSSLLAKFEELSLQQCLEKMGDVAFCPRCDRDTDSARVPCIQDEDGMAQCEVCSFVFCGRCREAYHPGMACIQLDSKLEALAAGRGKEAEAAKAELLTLRQLERSTKPCPSCGTSYEKTEGCSKMHCRVCDSNFCWRCGKTIEGYDHFATGACRLFDDEEIRRWNQQMAQMGRQEARAHEARFLQQFIDVETMREQLRQCPQCKSDVLKEGKNNHLRCASCWTPFCAVCRIILPKRKPGEHFQRGGCPQHSD
eukprot:TRINITY_DN55034_c0_g1_i1.p1 TRINITY_DN55034_c0_g1~~TRINITY_DN55034_c0_g1_i1.p1  ORF type:complete len:793 (-),score=201.15 TRINITY_DN55034_c0_g1_i1:167-2545(-)